jgi:two-component system phosphate regulon sensor histidine kinase PhoR
MSAYIHRRLASDRSRKRRLIGLLRDFRAAAAALPDGVVVLRAGSGILWLNEAAIRLLGLSARHRGGAIESVFTDPAVQTWLAAGPGKEPMVDVAAPGDPATRLSLRQIRYQRDQCLLVVRDITQLMRLEQVRRDFVANVSHELRTPLTVLHGYLDLMEPEDAPQWAPMLDDMRGQSRRMTQIVEDLLTLSRLEAPNALPDEIVPMRATLNTLEREAQALSRGRHKIVVEEIAPYDLRGAANYLHSAFSNLVSNAVRYTPDGGTIRIRWSATPRGGVFSVADSGNGIPAEHLPRLTERFYRVSTSRSRASGGTGLGLAIVKHVLHLHQAELAIESELGRGSTFSAVFGSERQVAARTGNAA